MFLGKSKNLPYVWGEVGEHAKHVRRLCPRGGATPDDQLLIHVSYKPENVTGGFAVSCR